MLRRAADAAGHLAIWTGLYVGAAVVCLAQTCGLTGLLMTARGGAALLCAALTATGVYLLDRIKLSDRWLDPADAAAKPARHAFLRRRTRQLRWLSLGVGLVGAACGWFVHPAAAALVPLAYAGVLVYAGRRPSGRRRPKDVLIVKNLAVACGIGVFALALIAALGPADRVAWLKGAWPALFAGALLLSGRVFADAVLCDIDDAEADRQFGTRTLPVQFGRGRTWGLVIAINLALVVGTWLPPTRGFVPARLFWSVSALATGVVLRWWNPKHLRDLIDIRLPVLAAAGVLLRRWLG